jgi:hypothetical protein
LIFAESTILDHLVNDLSHLRAARVAILNGVTFRHPSHKFSKAFDADRQYQLELRVVLIVWIGLVAHGVASSSILRT